LSEEAYNELLSSSEEYGVNDYWRIGSKLKEDGTTESIEFNISYDVKVTTGDIIVYVGINEQNTKIFLKSHNILNIVNGAGDKSIQMVGSGNDASGSHSIVFGFNNIASKD